MSVPSPENKGEGPIHHPEFYFPDGGAIFKLWSSDFPDGVLYNLHPGVLGHRSTFFSTLFSLPRGPDAPEKIVSEGKIDGNPIELPTSISMLDFDALLTYLYKGPSMYPSTEGFLISVMKLSAFFEIADGLDYTKQEFIRRGEQLHPALQFELARCFRIDPWIELAFRRLMKMSILSPRRLPSFADRPDGVLLANTNESEIQKLRTNIAFHVPPIVNAGDCDTPGYCMRAWSREWEERVRQLIHHPEEPISCLDLLDQLRNVHIDGLCNDCQDLTVTWIWGKCLLTREELFVDEAVEALMELQTDKPLRAAFSDSVAGLITMTR